ncbi:MAG TPA: bifunctional 5,10-methylenetetrahydrofolate dehydrogenase/5,10-methenyltetrahydrofolate cyclohydrolase [Candidatus Acidoferrales bacterium]|nr:bifunctional 5,10-methylenetetrahydrofolate dehydrogenase/5,10-methenyltetrahydrofolate cyclohydrolase [Candidatus Acidoferrales bacterium]
MTAQMIDGKMVASQVLEEVKAGIRARVQTGGPSPHLAVVLVGSDPASLVYVRNKRRDAEQVGLESTDHRLSETASVGELMRLVDRLNQDPAVSGIIVQQPLPAHMGVDLAVTAVDPAKDVDGFHPVNAGRLLLGQPGLVPCTPAGVMRLLDAYGIEPSGQRAVVLGRSNIVGKPTALLLLRRNATVTVCHSKTADLADICREADILVAAVGKPGFVKPEMVKPGAVVIDVGITPVDGRLRGDVDPAVAEVAGYMSPVPGGVGPMTRAMLLLNTLEAECQRRPT